tara:strand:+ start:93 stop:587 length:495 start_codon:yes stop_codon:yes gene_type:complete
MSTEKWSERICGDASQREKWHLVFKDHPEFFRHSADGKSVSLILRRQKPKLYDVDTLEMISREDRLARDTVGRARVSRSPLSESELQLLIGLATNFHSKALEDRRDGRWWMSIATTLIAASIGLAGVIVGSFLSNDSAAPVKVSSPKAEVKNENSVEVLKPSNQ